MKKILACTAGLIVAALITAVAAMTNSLLHLDSDGCVIWGIIVMALGVLLNVSLDALAGME